MSVRVEQDGEDVLVWVKAVPGASRDEVTGVVGDRLKVRVSAPPEGGRANRAICAVVAAVLGLKQSRLEIDHGASSPQKVIRVAATTVERVMQRLR